MQEVQTGIGVTNETTLETIEAIGTSSFKIREGRQTTGHYASSCSASGRVTYMYESGVTPAQSDYIKGTMNLDSMAGKSEFLVRNSEIRVPAAGTYLVTFTNSIGASNHSDSVYLKHGSTMSGDTVYSRSHSGSVDTQTASFYLDMGKFDVLSVWGTIRYTGSSTAASMKLEYSISLQQI